MARFRSLLLAITTAGTVALGLGAPAQAYDQPISVQRAQSQLDQAQTKLAQLNDQVERAQGRLDQANRTLSDDQKQQAALDKQLDQLARYQYTQPSLPMQIMRAGSLGEAMGEMAEARAISGRQQALLGEQKRINARDAAARDQIAQDLATVQKAEADAKALAAQAQQTLQDAQAEAARQQAAAIAAQASSINTGSSVGNHFSYGYCTWYVANRRPIPWYGNAIEWWPNARAYGFAEGGAPQVGAVMVTRESSAGHVAYVESVNSDGSWTVSEMNYVAWGVVSRRTIRYGQAPLVGFIYGKA
jgi:surface antigen